MYYALCRFFPVRATSDHWHEVHDDERNGSLVYGLGGELDESDLERVESAKSSEDVKGAVHTVLFP